MSLELCVVSSLEKILPAAAEIRVDNGARTIAKNETFSFQVAYRYPVKQLLQERAKISFSNSCEQAVLDVYDVRLVHTELATYSVATSDKNYLSHAPGAFPDILEPLDGEGVILTDYWRTLWVDFKPLKNIQPGTYTVTLTFTLESGQHWQISRKITVLDFELPRQTLYFTNWFHCDCLSGYYKTKIFSEKHWRLIETYVKTAAEYGMNTILTPVFTPPVDTAVNGERETVQLVKMSEKDGLYSFDFSLLRRWIQVCKEVGIDFFEMPHFFTQWGAKHAPKIIVNGEKRFGWHTDALCGDYAVFLRSFIPALLVVLREEKIDKNCFFHVSDEPLPEHLESYTRAKAVVAPLLAGYTLIDALSSIDFYKSGAIEHPVPANDHIEPFLKENIKGLWTYYCCVQCVDVSNRFLSMPSSRNRVLATQLFKYDIKGLLHWGFNFWFTRYSKKLVNPFCVTDAGLSFPGGDPFVVYPGADGPVLSLRLKVFKNMLDDLRAFQLLAAVKSRDFVMNLIESEGEITFSRFPSDPFFLLELRERVNRAICSG